MPTPILMPALSPTMEKGKLAKWLKAEGDEVRSGDVIAEIETDKATMEVEAVEEGTLARILVAEGTDDVPVNETIAVLLEEGEDASAADNFTAAAPAPAAAPPAEPGPAPAAQTAPAPAAPAPAAPAPAAPAASNGTRVFASPLAPPHRQTERYRHLRTFRLRPARSHRETRCRKGAEGRCAGQGRARRRTGDPAARHGR